jgi:hypothetical protein
MCGLSRSFRGLRAEAQDYPGEGEGERGGGGGQAIQSPTRSLSTTRCLQGVGRAKGRGGPGVRAPERQAVAGRAWRRGRLAARRGPSKLPKRRPTGSPPHEPLGGRPAACGGERELGGRRSRAPPPRAAAAAAASSAERSDRSATCTRGPRVRESRAQGRPAPRARARTMPPPATLARRRASSSGWSAWSTGLGRLPWPGGGRASWCPPRAVVGRRGGWPARARRARAGAPAAAASCGGALMRRQSARCRAARTGSRPGSGCPGRSGRAASCAPPARPRRPKT